MESLDRRRTFDAIWRIEAPKLIARLVRMMRDVDRAEELAQDAFVAALTQWPQIGIPRNPGAWLMTTAKRRAIDSIRRETMLRDKTEELQRTTELEACMSIPETLDNIDDDLLRLMFVSCHPVLSSEARVALTLRLLGGLTTAEIARAFLIPESTVAQRIVRAKRALADANVAFEVPSGRARVQRLASVLEAIYLIFNEGYAASTGDDVLRPELVQDALRLGRVLARLMPLEPEVHGLVALMELQASRMSARVAPDGSPILLLDQDRARWNQLLIQRGFEALGQAQRLDAGLGVYGLQAAIAACHARAHQAEETDWNRIAALYADLVALLPSPVIELNRAVAVGMADGPHAALVLIDRLADEPALARYHLLPSVRGDLLAKVGRFDEARREFERAATLAQNTHDQLLLRTRAAALKNNVYEEQR